MALHTLGTAENSRRRPTGPTGEGKNIQSIAQIYNRCAALHSPSRSMEEGRMELTPRTTKRKSRRLQNNSPDPPIAIGRANSKVVSKKLAAQIHEARLELPNLQVSDPPEAAPQHARGQHHARRQHHARGQHHSHCTSVVRAIQNATLTIDDSLDRINYTTGTQIEVMKMHNRIKKRRHGELIDAITTLTKSITGSVKGKDVQAESTMQQANMEL